jgi:hypothetical protein
MTMIRADSIAASLCLAILVAGVANADDKTAPAAPTTPKADKAAPAKSPVLKVGDTVYVCGCGESCHCTPGISAKPAKCGCGKDMVKAKVTKVGNGQVTVKPGSKPEQTFKTPYACGCGPSCTCNSASLQPGNCGCGKPLVKST